MTKLFYGNTTHPQTKGRVFRNARYFVEIDPKATDVMIDGDYPNIAAAYKAAGVPVSQADPAAYTKEAEKQVSPEPAVSVPSPSKG